MRFEDMNLAPEVLRASAKIGWDRPTPLQQRAIPAILGGRDVAIFQSSGAGKTAAYLLPLLHRLGAGPKPGLRALVLTPAGDHASKVSAHCSGLGPDLSIAFADLGVDGVDPTGTAVALATPTGLPLDPTLLAGLEILVVDGIEGWLEQGGEESLRAVCAAAPEACQRVFLSDTLSPEVAGLHAALLRSPALFPALEGTQVAYPVPPPLKVQLLLRLVEDEAVAPSLVLARSRHRADRLFRALNRKGIRALRIQGRAGRGQRERWAQALLSGQKTFLVSAELDLGAYGPLALPSVIYFDTPGSPQGYAGRFQGAFYGPEGKTLIFVGDEEESRLKEIEAHFSVEIPRTTLEGFDYTVPEQPDREEEGEGDSGPRPQPTQQERGRGRGEGRRGRKGRAQGQGQPQGKPQPQPKPRPQVAAPRADGDAEDEDDGPQPDYNTDRPLFPGQRAVRWNAFRLSLERFEEGAGAPRQGGERGAGDDAGAARKRKKRKVRSQSGDGAQGREFQARPGRPIPEGDEDFQPDSNEGERKPTPQEVVARRFNRSARYSSLAGAPIAPTDRKEDGE